MSKLIPRPYQLEAYKAIIQGLRDGGVPYVNMSTGSGKNLTAAMLADKVLQQGGRALVLVPSKELVVQNHATLFDYTDFKRDIGVCCAKLDKYQINKNCVIATYTSFLSRRAKAGKFNVLILDECHYLSAKFDSSYQKIIRSLKRINPDLKICGLSATPFRVGQGELHNDCVDGKATFTKCVYTTDIAKLIHEGYLSRIESISGDIQADLSDVKMKSGDYDQEMAAVKFEAILPNAIPDIKIKIELYGIQTALIFASNVANARAIIELWGDDTARIVYGDMSAVDRVKTIEWLKNGKGQRIIVNVNVLLVGFDFRKLDAVIFLRATKSLALYMQAVGRVLRAHDEKDCGYVLDYAGNVDRHGSIDGVIPPKTIKKAGDAPQKICLECETVNLAAAKFCKQCGAEFVPDPNAAGLYAMRSKAEILRSKWQTVAVDSVSYEVVLSKNGDIPMIRAEYYDEFSGLIVKQHLCLQHNGLAQTIAQQFLLKMFKNPREFYALNAAEGLNCVDVCDLLTNIYDDYFKKIVSVTVGDQVDNTKYKELKSCVFAIDSEKDIEIQKIRNILSQDITELQRNTMQKILNDLLLK